MSVTLSVSPRAKVFTKLPVLFTWSYQFVAITDFLQVQVIDVNNILVTELRYPFPQTSGTIQVDFKKILDAVASYSTRPSTVPTSTIVDSGNRYPFTLRYKQLSFPNWQQSGTFYAFKGGFASLVPNDEYFLNTPASNLATWLPTPSGYMTFLPKKRLMGLDEYGWIAHYTDIAAGSQFIQYVMNFTDGSTQTITKNFTTTDFNGQTFHIPIGLPQIGFTIGTKTPAYWYVWAFQNGNMIANIQINADLRPNYTPMTIYYRNSLGGWDHFRFRGKITNDITTEKSEYETPDLLKTYGSNPHYDSQSRIKWKAYTGYINKELITALYDLLNSKECCLLLNGAWLPVRTTTTKFTYRDSTEGKYNEAIEFETSGSFDTIPKQLLVLL